jgi:hypothetical protein
MLYSPPTFVLKKREMMRKFSSLGIGLIKALLVMIVLSLIELLELWIQVSIMSSWLVRFIPEGDAYVYVIEFIRQWQVPLPSFPVDLAVASLNIAPMFASFGTYILRISPLPVASISNIISPHSHSLSFSLSLLDCQSILYKFCNFPLHHLHPECNRFNTFFFLLSFSHCPISFALLRF